MGQAGQGTKVYTIITSRSVLRPDEPRPGRAAGVGHGAGLGLGFCFKI